MSELWVDANVLLRLVTKEPNDLYQRASRLAEQAERREVTLRLSPLVVAMVWVLRVIITDTPALKLLKF